MKSQVIACFISLAAVVLSHGGIFFYIIDGIRYAGNTWLLDAYAGGVYPTPDPPPPSIQRRWYYAPIFDPMSKNMTCSYDGASTPTALHATIKAGSNISTDYQNPNRADSWPNDWNHSEGPMLAYMAACPGESCEGFDGSGKVWFKIDQTGLAPSAVDLRGPWIQLYTISSSLQGPGYTVTIPKNLKPGNYLIRHEIIMVRSKPPQFYPDCAQLTVTGDGTKFPGDEYLVSFPGAYSLEDPGLAMTNDWFAPGRNPVLPEWETLDYPFPGPPLWTGD
ncbi:Uncharacterized protein BP5553_04186 [Venustampulla echinocandica]|uniref:AA9 family lytic polysaccharide monooxygenase n=1 Tax=Venustampulla echinocandica TaxID=2656787 RepID=A0A370TWD6_9HELO|nr:Uncharacterized protein BP5553_04186 [Venustampulla echinocandica]RDL39846.1 Uncharacterized protein BP5553_04186 [Venustampulla echinocandica]